jgi:hypothetical protein
VGARLERAEHFGEGHRLRVRTQQLEGLEVRGIGRGADLQALDVGRAVDRPLVVAQAAKADLPEGQALDLVRAEFVEQRAADRAVERAVGLLRIGELVGQVERIELGREAGHEGVAGGADVDGAAAHAGHQRHVVAELAVGEDLDLHRAAGALLHALRELERGLVLRIALGHGVAEAQLDRRLRRGAAGTEAEQRGQQRAGQGPEIPVHVVVSCR